MQNPSSSSIIKTAWGFTPALLSAIGFSQTTLTRAARDQRGTTESEQTSILTLTGKSGLSGTGLIH